MMKKTPQILCMLFLVAISATYAKEQQPLQVPTVASLFATPAPVPLALDRATVMPSGFPPALRSRPVALDKTTVSLDGAKVGRGLKLDFFSDAVYTSQVDRVTENTEGTVTIRGRIEGYPLATVILTTTGGRSLGVVDIPEQRKKYTIQSEAGSEAYYLIDVDLNRTDTLEGGAVADSSEETH